MIVFKKKMSCWKVKVFPQIIAYLAKKKNNFGVLVFAICFLKIFNKFSKMGKEKKMLAQ